MVHIVIVESNTPELVAESRARGRLSEADNYAAVLRQIDPGLHITVVSPYAGETFLFPPPLKAADGVVFTGSSVAWCVDDPRAEALEGVMRAVFAARVPAGEANNPFSTENLLEATDDGVGGPKQPAGNLSVTSLDSLGAVACCPLFLLTCALPMTSFVAFVGVRVL